MCKNKVEAITFASKHFKLHCLIISNTGVTHIFETTGMCTFVMSQWMMIPSSMATKSDSKLHFLRNRKKSEGMLESLIGSKSQLKSFAQNFCPYARVRLHEISPITARPGGRSESGWLNQSINQLIFCIAQNHKLQITICLRGLPKWPRRDILCP